MPPWSHAAQFTSLQASGLALQRLEAVFFGRPEYRACRQVSVGPNGAHLIVVAALAREDFHVLHDVALTVRHTFEAFGGMPIVLDPAIRARFFEAWEHLGSNQVIDFNPELEGPLVVTSHAKCADCGGNRHKIARLNICQPCWEKVKPAQRREWRNIKDRRRLRRSVEEYFEEQHRQRAHQQTLVELRQLRNGESTVMAPNTPMTREEAQLEIARIRAEGVPPPGSPERTAYMRLHAIANYGTSGRPVTINTLTPQDKLLLRLYTETDLQVKEIFAGLGVDANRLLRARKLSGTKTREDMIPWRPKYHINEGEELVLVGNEPMFRSPTGLLRPVFEEPKPDPIPQPEPEPEPQPDPEPVPVAEREQPEQPEPEQVQRTDVGVTVHSTPRKRKYAPRSKSLPMAVQEEIVRLYQDPEIPVYEIQRAYDIPNGTLYRILERFKIDRGLRRSPGRGHVATGRLELINGRHEWVPGEPGQLHLGAAPGAQEPLPEPAPESPAHKEQAPMPPDAQDWIAQATRTLEAEEAARQQTAALEVNGEHSTLPVPLAVPEHLQVRQRAWAVTFVMTRTELVAAPTIDEALRVMRERHGEEIDVTGVQRA